MKYEDALNYINNLEFFGIKLGLDNMKKLLNQLGNPENKLKFIHIAGTNGKGSVASYLSNILYSSGFKVGTYTSPHLIKLEERFCLNLKPIDSDSLCSIADELFPVIEELKGGAEACHPTYFEVTTALALLYFARENVDYVVWETGLGGRLDATNVVSSKIQIITNIGLDHTRQLGNTLRQIAIEKAGIIKEGGTVITGAEGEALEEINSVAAERNAIVYQYPRDFSCQLNQLVYKTSGENKWPVGQEFHFSGRLLDYSNLFTQMSGSHQLQNVGLALGALEVLLEKSTPAVPEGVSLESPMELKLSLPKYKVNDDLSGGSCLPLFMQKLVVTGIPEGIKNAFWPGRLELISENPLVLLDGAHNQSGATVLRESLERDFSYKRLLMVIGISEGEERKDVINILTPLADELFITSANSSRAVPLEELTQLVQKTGKPFQIAKKSLDALKYAMDKARQNDLICVTGSLYLIGDIRPYFNNSVTLIKGKPNAE